MPGAEGEQRARLLYLRGVIESSCGDMRDASEAAVSGVTLLELATGS
jgi:hypothetical protein